MVASHTAVPLGTAKWLVRAIPTHGTLPLGKGHGLTMSPTQGQAIFLWGVFLSSHFEKPKGFSVWLATIVRCLWHLPLSVYTVCSVALVPQGAALGWWLIAPFRGAFVRTIIADGHCRCAGTLHPDFKSGERDFVK